MKKKYTCEYCNKPIEELKPPYEGYVERPRCKTESYWIIKSEDRETFSRTYLSGIYHYWLFEKIDRFSRNRLVLQAG